MFKKAEKKQVKLKMGLTGPSGSGKTFSALKIAKGMVEALGGGKIAVIDTENRSASRYADRFDFDVAELDPPYTTDRYIQMLKAAETAGYSVIILDSTSHQWAGEGGLLNEKEKMDARGGNSFTNWAKMTPHHERFKSALVHCGAHLICTMRSKQDYQISQNEKGKSTPQKVGLAPIQRDGMEYELDLVLDMDMAHQAAASKDRTSVFDGQLFKPDENTGKKLINWLNAGTPVSWSFGQREKDDLRALMNSFATGKQLFKEWEIEKGPIAGINEEYYRGLTQRLTEESMKGKADPNSFDNF